MISESEKVGKGDRRSEFLQSAQWADFQDHAGHTAIRLDEKIPFFGYEHTLKGLMKYLYIPRVDASLITDSLCDNMKKRGYVFLRVEPGDTEISDLSYEIVQTRCRQPAQTLYLDLSGTHDELLSRMHSKTRYNIRLAQKKGVRVSAKKDVDVFWKLNEQTTNRDGFSSHDKLYYDKMLSLPMVHQLTAYHGKDPLASNIYVGCGNVMTYLHGSSSSEKRNFMAPYLLQFEGMLLGKILGADWYDFWGVSPLLEEDAQKKGIQCLHGKCWSKEDRWSGITRFKVSFGGEYSEYPSAYEVVLKKGKYTMYCMAKKVV